jgi:hypothetical protein
MLDLLRRFQQLPFLGSLGPRRMICCSGFGFLPFSLFDVAGPPMLDHSLLFPTIALPWTLWTSEDELLLWTGFPFLTITLPWTFGTSEDELLLWTRLSVFIGFGALSLLTLVVRRVCFLPGTPLGAHSVY